MVRSVHAGRKDLVAFEPQMPATLVSSEAPLQLRPRIDRSRLFQLAHRIPATVSTSVVIDYEGPDGWTSESVPLTLRAVFPPELEVLPDAKPPEMFKADTAEFEIRFRNRKPGDPVDGRHNAPLRIVALDLEPPEASPGTNWAEALRRPIEIAGGETGSARLRLAMESFPVGLNHLAVSVRTNRQELDTTHHIDFLLRPVGRFNGLLAIDFGTSNTCCFALAKGAAESNPIKIDDDPTSSPTVLRYKSIQGESAEVEIGQKVKRAATVEVRSAMATISRLKQRLGDRGEIYVRPIGVETGTLRAPRYAVGDYLREVRRAAEQSCHGYFGEFVMTHPAVCSLRQYRNLQWAVRAAFSKEAKISFLQEPIASLIPLIRHRAMMASPLDHYRVAAFDLGGGSTDVTLAEIDRKVNGLTAYVSLRVISSWGVRWGGENLTDFLVSHLRKRCEQKAPEQQILLSPREDREAEDERLNRFLLRDWAERWKIAASKDQRFSAQLSLRVRRKRDGQTDFYVFEDLDGPLASGRTLQQEYEAELEQRLLALSTRLKKGLGEPGQNDLNVLQLSGKSCAIRQIKEFFKKQFEPSGTEVISLPDDELKECVVKGACLWQQMQNSPSLRLETPNSLQITTSRIGLWDAGKQKFDEVIPLGRPIGEPGPPYPNYRWVVGQGTIELHENLSEKDEDLAPDELQALGSFEPVNAPILRTKDLNLTLNLLITNDYWPALSATTESGESIQFRLVPD
jgi:hypothetical protein